MEALHTELFCKSDEELGLQSGELTRNRETNKTFDEQYCWARHTEPEGGINYYKNKNRLRLTTYICNFCSSARPKLFKTTHGHYRHYPQHWVSQGIIADVRVQNFHPEVVKLIVQELKLCLSN